MVHRTLLALIFSFAFIACSDSPVDPLPFEEESTENHDEESFQAPTPFDFATTAPWYPCPEDPLDSKVIEVEALSEIYQYFGEENHRTVETNIQFPEGTFAQAGLFFELTCPQGGCDHWDRAGSLELILNPDAPEDDQEVVEILRHITPYRMGMCQFVDITALLPLLKGTRGIRSFIDTWVGPGHSDGEGWLVSLRFAFFPISSSGNTDFPETEEGAGPQKVINIWERHNITVGQLDPDQNIASQVEPFQFTLPPDFERVEAHLTTTGHSFGNTHNCAEFCAMLHVLDVNGENFTTNPWRGDCAENPVSPQAGTWRHNRNGWCPGAVALGDVIDITTAVESGENILDFDILLDNGRQYDNRSPVDLLPYTIVSLKLYVF